MLVEEYLIAKEEEWSPGCRRRMVDLLMSAKSRKEMLAQLLMLPESFLIARLYSRKER
jgi:hypothetical protein